MQATAQSYLLGPELLGNLGAVKTDAVGFGNFGWPPLAAVLEEGSVER